MKSTERGTTRNLYAISTFLVMALSAPALSIAAEDAEKGESNEDTSSNMESMGATLSFADKPVNFEIESFGPMTLSFVGSGLSQWQTNPVSGDRAALADAFNGHVILQKSTGEWQFLIHAGVYSFPTLGAGYFRAGKTIYEFYGPVPEAYIKYAPSDKFSIIAGKIPSMGGVENNFTYQNLNINLGLLWNLTSSISRGVQANLTAGPFDLSFAWTDGYYTGRYTWLSGSLSWTIDEANSLMFIGTANTKPAPVDTIAAPITQNNSQIFNLIYTYASGPWTFIPYLQMTRVPATPHFGLNVSGRSFGAAILAAYAFPKTSKLDEVSLRGFSLPVRFEYLAARAEDVDGAPNLLFGVKSSAWSATITPTLQRGPFFFRAEYAYVHAPRFALGSGFGKDGDRRAQSRISLEAGFIY